MRPLDFKTPLLWLCSEGAPAAWAAESGSRVEPTAIPAADANATRMTDIHDIKPLIAPGMDLQWLFWVLAAAAVLVLGVWGWRLWAKRRRPVAARPDEPPVPAETEAYRLFDALAAEGNLNPKQFYFALSAILRRYIERRYEIPAAEMTTEELLPNVDRLPLNGELAQPLKDFCRRADPIKYAGAGAVQDRMAKDLSFARDFVRQTTEMLKAAPDNSEDEQAAATIQKPALQHSPLKSAKG